MHSQTNPENEAHLIIRFAFGPGGLGEGSDGGEPAIATIGSIWTEEEIVFGFRAAPIRQNNLVQRFRSDRNSGANFVARAESLYYLAVMLAQTFAFPFCFQRQVVS